MWWVVLKARQPESPAGLRVRPRAAGCGHGVVLPLSSLLWVAASQRLRHRGFPVAPFLVSVLTVTGPRSSVFTAPSHSSPSSWAPCWVPPVVRPRKPLFSGAAGRALETVALEGAAPGGRAAVGSPRDRTVLSSSGPRSPARTGSSGGCEGGSAAFSHAGGPSRVPVFLSEGP